MSDVLLVTCSALPEGELGGALLVDQLADRGASASWVAWDDPAVDWSAASLVAVRSPWDYETRRDEFLGWARSVEEATHLVNPASVLEWNTDKVYLLDLITAGLPVVPTRSAEHRHELTAAIASFGNAVVKPRVGAGGRGVVLFDGPPDPGANLDTSPLPSGPWIVQPLVESIRSQGETSVFVLGGEAFSAVRKLPAVGEIRVHEEFGGRSVTASLTEEAAALACTTVTAAERLLGTPLSYARVDMMRLGDGTLVVSELEVTEPGLYLEVVPGNAKPFADAMVALL
ncbi:MAG TPA: hypothetical protein VFD59_12960 [Nocardioidaceae bacterium]|nr:hypothetical protein [Nocardioidaceae bacterium]